MFILRGYALENSKAQESVTVKLRGALPISKMPVSASASRKPLTFKQCEKLSAVMREPVQLSGKNRFPVIELEMIELVSALRQHLIDDPTLSLDGVKLNGSVASYVLSQDNTRDFNDIDLIFYVSIKSEIAIHRIKDHVISVLKEFMTTSKEYIDNKDVSAAFLFKMFKLCDNSNCWSLLSLCDVDNRSIDLKFIDKMKRKYEFSIDSFQIELEPLLSICRKPMSPECFPVVWVESLFGPIEDSIRHLNQKIIATKCVEEIRGGGLLKYCHLLARKYNTVSKDYFEVQKYMCSRFFIDFPKISSQSQAIWNYMLNHLKYNNEIQLLFLSILLSVIKASTVCLMNLERREIISWIEYIRFCMNFQTNKSVYCSKALSASINHTSQTEFRAGRLKRGTESEIIAPKQLKRQ